MDMFIIFAVLLIECWETQQRGDSVFMLILIRKADLNRRHEMVKLARCHVELPKVFAESELLGFSICSRTTFMQRP